MPDLIEHLHSRMAQPLPGRSAQFKMASVRRLQELGPDLMPPANAQVACVLNLLHRQDDAWRTVLIRRTANPRDRHSGQVSFPGGRREEHDNILADVALREAEEEVGVSASQIRILGQLTELYIPVSNYLVTPFVGVLEGPTQFRPQPGEVESILTPQLLELRLPASRKTTDIRIADGRTLLDVPYFDVEGCVVWGATAMILSEFLELMP